MILRVLLLPLLVIALAIALIACGDDDEAAPDNGNGAPLTEAPTNGDDNGDTDNGDTDNGNGVPPTEAPTNGDDNGDTDNGGTDNGVNGTLTIGDETWEFTGIRCVEIEGNPTSRFNIVGFGRTADSARIQLSADIYDYGGDGESYRIGISDIDIANLTDPTVYWETVLDTAVLTINGKDVHGVGAFDDVKTLDEETVPGELNVTCP